jgi:hypothetical protein
MRILRNAFGAGGGDKTYRLTFWIAVAGIAVMMAWLRVVGVHLWLAALIVLFIVLSHIVVSRVLAETGLPFYRSVIAVSQVYTTMPISWFTGRDIYFAGVSSLGHDHRDGLMFAIRHGVGAAGVKEPAIVEKLG